MRLPKYSTPPKKRNRLLLIRRVIGQSMVPTLRPNHIVVATSWFKTIRPEHIVVIHHDGLEKIKRVRKVYNGRVFVVGDNERASIDSRSFGWLPLDAVIAKVVWPRY